VVECTNTLNIRVNDFFSFLVSKFSKTSPRTVFRYTGNRDFFTFKFFSAGYV
jgi:hypothetical protein